jgi:hypothetical protein
MYGLTYVLGDYLTRSRVASRVFCGLAFVASTLGAVHGALALYRYPRQPTELSSLDAGSVEGWIHIRSAQLDCWSGITGGSGQRSFRLRDTASRDVVVDINGACDPSPHDLEGVLDPLTPRRMRYLESQGMRFRPGAERYELSTMSGPNNDAIGLATCGTMALGSVVLYQLLERRRWRKYPHLALR